MKNSKGILIITVALAAGVPALAADFTNPYLGPVTGRIVRTCGYSTDIDAGLNDAGQIVSLSVRRYLNGGQWDDRADKYHQLSLYVVHPWLGGGMEVEPRSSHDW